MKQEVTSKIIDDAWRKIAGYLYEAYGGGSWGNAAEADRAESLADAGAILTLSGTTDIECPDCEGEGTGEWGGNGIMFGFEACPKCNGAGSIPYRWEIEDFIRCIQEVK